MIKKFNDLKRTDIENKNFFLTYGKNNGIQDEILHNYFIKDYSKNLLKYEEVEFIDNYDDIVEGLLTKSLFEENKLIIISRVTDRILKYFEAILNKDISNIKFFLRTGVLEKKSKLRSFFEKNNKVIVIPVYEDNYRSLYSFIEKFLSANKIILSRESINLLINRSGNDRFNLKIELNKIYNYSITNKKIDLEIIKKLSNLVENYSVYELADSYLEKNKKNLSKILNENNYSNEDCILILRTIMSKSKRLLSILESSKYNKNIDNVIALYKPPIFWKEKEIVKKQVNKWVLEDLKNKIYKINDIELLIKKNASTSLNLLSNFIVND